MHKMWQGNRGFEFLVQQTEIKVDSTSLVAFMGQRVSRRRHGALAASGASRSARSHIDKINSETIKAVDDASSPHLEGRRQNQGNSAEVQWPQTHHTENPAVARALRVSKCHKQLWAFSCVSLDHSMLVQ